MSAIYMEQIGGIVYMYISNVELCADIYLIIYPFNHLVLKESPGGSLSTCNADVQPVIERSSKGRKIC